MLAWYDLTVQVQAKHKMAIQWSPSITDTTGTKDFVLYSEVSFAQGVIVDHARFTVMASYAGERLWTMKSVLLIYLGYIVTVDR